MNCSSFMLGDVKIGSKMSVDKSGMSLQARRQVVIM